MTRPPFDAPTDEDVRIVSRQLGRPARDVVGISAGGMPDRVKCLHALVGHTLAAGPGVNPIGDLALERCAWSPTVCECVDYSTAESEAS